MDPERPASAGLTLIRVVAVDRTRYVALGTGDGYVGLIDIGPGPLPGPDEAEVFRAGLEVRIGSPVQLATLIPMRGEWFAIPAPRPPLLAARPAWSNARLNVQRLLEQVEAQLDVEAPPPIPVPLTPDGDPPDIRLTHVRWDERVIQTSRMVLSLAVAFDLRTRRWYSACTLTGEPL